MRAGRLAHDATLFQSAGAAARLSSAARILIHDVVQPGEALDVAAQVAVTLAGFAGIVVVFRPESVHQWSPLDKLRLRFLLLNSFFPLTYALFGIFLLTVDPPPVAIWRWCSGFAIAVGVSSSAVLRGTFSGRVFDDMTKVLFYSMAVLGTISFLLQFANVLFWNRFWPFFAAIFFHLVGAMLQFLRIVLLPAAK